MKIVSYEDYIKNNKKSDVSKAITEYQELKAKIDYSNTKKAADNAQKTIKTAIKDEQKRLGVQTPTLAPLARTNTVEYTDDNGRLKFKSAFENNQENINKYTQQVQKNQQITNSSPVINQLKNISQEVNNQKLLAKYNYDVAKEANHDINLWDRTAGVITRAGSDFFNPEKLNSSNYYVNGDNRMVLPTASQIRQENVRNSYGDDILGKAMKMGTDIGYNITKIGLSSAINTIAPGAGSTMYFSDMASDSFNQAKLDGYDDKSAALYSVVGVVSEMLTERFLGGLSKKIGLSKGDSSLASGLNRVLGKVMKNDKLRSVLSNSLSEGAEEFVQEYIENFNKNLILEKQKFGEALDNTVTWDTFKDAVYSTLVGMGSGALMNVGQPSIDTNNTGIIPTIKDGQVDVKTYVNDLEKAKANTKNQTKINNINQVLDNINASNTLNDSYSQFAQQIANNQTNNRNFRAQINDNVINEISLTNNMPSELKQLGINGDNLKIERSVVNKALQSGLSQDTVDTIPTALNNPSYILDNGKNGVRVISELNNNNTAYSVDFNVDYNGNVTDVNIESEPMTTSYLKTTIYPLIKESQNNGTLLYDYINGIANNTNQTEVLPGNGNLSVLSRVNQQGVGERLQYAQTADPKVNNLYESASKYYDNTESSTNLLNTLSKIVKDKGYNIIFDDTNMKGINGEISSNNGEVTIKLNPNSPRALEFVLVHEITHAIETNSLKKMVIKYAENYAKDNGLLIEYEAAKESLKNNYSEAEIPSEIIADISGQMLGNQEFINNLSMEKPGIFKTLYNNIKAWYHKMRGWKSQSEFLEDLMNKWEYAYATQQNNLKNETEKSKTLNGYYPEIIAKTSNVNKLEIKNINNIKDVVNKITKHLENKYLSTEKTSKPIQNIDTKMNIEIWKSSIKESFGNENYYANLSHDAKLKKLAIIDNLAKMVKYGEIRAQDASNKHNPNSPARYYYLEHPITIDGKEYMVNMDIRKVPNTNGRFYIYSISDNIAQKKVGTLGNQNGRLLKVVPTNEVSISQNNNNVKSDISTKYSMQENQRVATNDLNEYIADAAVRQEQQNIADRQAIREMIEDYVKENDINNPTLEQLQNSMDDYDMFDNMTDMSELQKAENLYKELAKELYDEKYNKSSSMDSKRKILSQEQQEYFKNSKVRDDKGRLQRVYHGTDNGDFTVFDRNKIGENLFPAYGEGFYFSSNKSTSEAYTGKDGINNVKSVYLNIENPYYATDADIGKINTNELIKQGYDGVITGFGNDKEYVVFNSNQIKNIDNTNPTTNEDIRFSRNNKGWQQYLEDNFESKGTKTYARDILSRENTKGKEINHYVVEKVTKNLKGNDVLKASKLDPIVENIRYNRLNENTNNNSKAKYTLSEINDMFQFADSEDRVFALPNDVGKRIADNTNVSADILMNLNSILDNITDTKIKGDNIEVKCDYWDNSTIDIKATKIGNTYVIDDVRKVAKTPNQIMRDMENYKSGTKYSKETNAKKTNTSSKQEISTNNDFVTFNEAAKESINKIRQSYENTANTATDLKESKFYKNATETSEFITPENRNNLSKIGDLKYYEGVTNEESLNKAAKRLRDGGAVEANYWLKQDVKTSDSVDVAEGWILLANYQEQGNYDAMVEVAKKMREMGTKAGQAVQAYNILARLTPEGMVKYAQNQLGEAFDIYAKNKSQSWIDQNASKFDLTPQETGFIVDTMKQVQNMEDGRAKNVKLGEIQAMLENKLPPEKGSAIKSWMRISMLFNPKTQVRNVMGNAIITPVNMIGDYFASKVDKAISKKTGVRTTGTIDAQNYIKGFKKGLYESYDDFRRGINTRDVKGNRFEIGQGKSFNDNTKIGKALNKVDSLNSFLLDAGDRGFYEAAFTNSINNQLVLNNTSKVTQSMIDIATAEALQRTWQDNNNYTKFVLQTRNGLNKINVKGYGLGDILIPFAKTPANLTKAIVDYSPAGMVKALIEGRNLKNNISTGKNTAIEQHQFVQDLGKATAGTMLYLAAYGLAKAGIATGKSDDDKDTRDFIKNTLGVNSYSIKIGDKSFTYDWAQPVAAPLSIMTNIANSKDNKGQALLEAVTSSLDSAGSILLEQSFLKSINEVLTDNNGVVSGIENAILDLPARAVPTFMKQIADLTDSTQRQTFEYGQPLKTAKNKIVSKIPGLNQTLTPSVDSMGREIQKYGGKNNIFNVFINPANVNTSNISKGAEEIYRVYKEVGDKTIMPRVAPYYINSKGQKTILNTEQRKDYQKISGNIIEESVNELLNNKNYKQMSDEEKSSVINNIVNYSYSKAKQEVLGMKISGYKTLENWLSNGGTVASYYANKEEADFSVNSPVKYSALKNMKIDYYDYKDYQKEVNKIKEQYSGTANTNIRKQKVFNYINDLSMSKNKKIILFKLLGNYSIKNYSSAVADYINSFDITAKEKQEIWSSLM